MNDFEKNLLIEGMRLKAVEHLIEAQQKNYPQDLITTIERFIIGIEKGKDNYLQDPETGRMMGSIGSGSGGSKPITPITDKAVERVPNVSISGYTDEQCAFIQQQHKELLTYSHDKNGDKEVAFVFDGELKSRKEFKGTDDKLDFGGALHGKDLFVMHNHPRNSSYSTMDIDFFAGNSCVKTLTIVTNNGRVETITKSSQFSLSLFQKEYNRLYKKIVVTDTDSERDKFVKTLLSKTKSGVIWNVG